MASGNPDIRPLTGIWGSPLKKNKLFSRIYEKYLLHLYYK